MNIAFNDVAMAVLKRPLQDCSLDELQQLTHQYPYFGPAHLLLAKKLQEENSSAYEEQVQRASLYFQNRLWLNYLLNDDHIDGVVIEYKQEPDENKESPPAIYPDPSLTIPVEVEAIQLSHEEEIIEPTTFAEPVSVNGQPAYGTSNQQDEDSGELDPEETDEKIQPFMKISEFKIEPFSPGSELVFEPYHTVDYFASQGIKFKEEDKPSDRFSKQLKSFTEWLKTMKRVPASEITVPIDLNNEQKIERLAEFSVAERHVITEAMAEVWEKQGNKLKAEEIYRKLSLLDPSKSSYFASKIEELKKTS